ncbi:hypothetical protein BDV96DRAFT_651814 [Lophiotrema nucula]|uniref:Uncharacterized protein n=1 Tax=Lophiotrema nucula TaxID=690887 RepID=A0A6A5YRM1_9PLEO|nr:hypothetical protein BDV96DRAFT_651814 [Lophiotrema nucula]
MALRKHRITHTLHYPSIVPKADFPFLSSEILHIRKDSDSALLSSRRDEHFHHSSDPNYWNPMLDDEDWPIHKILCSSSNREFSIDKRPKSDCIRGIYFNPEGKQPEFMWIKTGVTEDHNGLWTSFAVLSNLPGTTRGERPQLTEVISDTTFCPTIYPPIAMYQCGTGRMLFTHEKQNLSLASIDDGFSCWKGPVLFLGMWRDLETRDLRYIVDKLRDLWDCSWRRQLLYPPPCVETVPGVRMNCNGDIDLMDCPELEEVKMGAQYLGPDHPNRMDNNGEIPVGSLIGLPLFCVSLGWSFIWRDRTHDDYAFVDALKILHPGVAEYAITCGTVYVFRKDLKPLHTAHLLALIEYCHELEPDVSLAESPERNRRLLARASKAGFEQFWEEILMRRVFRDCRDLPSPYDV